MRGVVHGRDGITLWRELTLLVVSPHGEASTRKGFGFAFTHLIQLVLVLHKQAGVRG